MKNLGSPRRGKKNSNGIGILKLEKVSKFGIFAAKDFKILGKTQGIDIFGMHQTRFISAHYVCIAKKNNFRCGKIIHLGGVGVVAWHTCEGAIGNLLVRRRSGSMSGRLPMLGGSKPHKLNPAKMKP